jgi:CRP-like cAMP-binding protein
MSANSDVPHPLAIGNRRNAPGVCPTVSKPVEAKNHLLTAIPEAERAALTTRLETVRLARGDVLLEPGVPVQSIFFPETCVVSAVQPFSTGEEVETSTIGCEGLICVSAALNGAERARLRHVVQIGGEAARLPRDAFLDSLQNLPDFRRLFLDYAGRLIGTLMLSVACNRVHTVEKRLARWLLMTRDRSQTEHLPMTHDVIAQMLGVHRPTVSVAMRALEIAGTIEARRGRVTIRDRRALEVIACECYRLGARQLPAQC